MQLYERAKPSWLPLWGRVSNPLDPAMGHYRRQVIQSRRIRELGPEDVPAIVLHYALLGTENRQSRFGARMNYSALSDRYNQLDWDHARFLGIFSGRQLVALAEVVDEVLDGQPAKEIAFSVLPGWQGAGAGDRLMERAVEKFSRGARLPLIVYTRPINRPMAHLALKFGGIAQVVNGENAYVILPPETGADEAAA